MCSAKGQDSGGCNAILPRNGGLTIGAGENIKEWEMLQRSRTAAGYYDKDGIVLYLRERVSNNQSGPDRVLQTRPGGRLRRGKRLTANGLNFETTAAGGIQALFIILFIHSKFT